MPKPPRILTNEIRTQTWTYPRFDGPISVSPRSDAPTEGYTMIWGRLSPQKLNYQDGWTRVVMMFRTWGVRDLGPLVPRYEDHGRVVYAQTS